MQKVIRILQLRIFGDEGERSTSSREVSPASPFQSPASEGARRTAVTSGLTCSVPFTRSGPVGSLVRTLVASSRWYSRYTVQPLLIPACAVGAPHRRDRVWFVAHADSLGFQDKGPRQPTERAARDHPRDAAAHPDSDGDTPLATGGTLETSGAHVHARGRGRGEEPQRSDGFPGLPWATPDPDGKGLERSADTGEFRAEREEPAAGQPSRFFRPGWEEFPTQSPVCGRDDGIPCQLDGITFSSWRQQSVKGYGNAIVPQVIYEIFKAIESTYK